MTQVNINEAKTNLSRLIKKALEGEEIIIANAQKPLVKLVKIDNKDENRKLGLLKGRITIGDDFDETPVDFKDYI